MRFPYVNGPSAPNHVFFRLTHFCEENIQMRIYIENAHVFFSLLATTGAASIAQLRRFFLEFFPTLQVGAVRFLCKHVLLFLLLLCLPHDIVCVIVHVRL